MPTEPQKMRRFDTWVRVQSAASLDPVGQVRLGRNISQPDKPSKAAEMVKTQILCWLSMMSMGKLLVIAATVAPRPRETKIIGRAQQIKVLVVANSASHVAPVFFLFIRYSFAINRLVSLSVFNLL